MAEALVLATLQTKRAAAEYLVARLAARGVSGRLVDISLAAEGQVLDGAAKRKAMAAARDRVLEDVAAASQSEAQVIIGMGGGTGGEIALSVLHGLPVTFPKVLVCTMPFDPRAAVADNSIVLVPTLADIAGLGPILRGALDQAASVGAGLAAGAQAPPRARSIAITGLGATDAAVAPLVRSLDARGQANTVFHSNGYGGAAFARFAAEGAFDAVVDLTPHEATRLHLAGAHVPMPGRFSAAPEVPRVVLPGGLNFIGLGARAQIDPKCLARPHYVHSGHFTHVKLTGDEMAEVTAKLAETINALTGPRAVIVPMGGFSHQDRPGGEIEDPALRQICLDTFRRRLDPAVPLTALDHHLFAPEVTRAILETLLPMIPRKEPLCTT